MNIGIIGLGWLGLPLAKSLLNKGHVIYGTTRTAKIDSNHLNFIPLHLDPTAKVKNPIYELSTCEVVVFAFPPDRTSIRTYAKNCVNILRHLAPDVHVVLISSTSVYPHRSGSFQEFDIEADFLHQSSIGYAEDTLGSLLQNRLTIIRMGGLIGPNRYPVLSMVKANKPYTGNEPINVIHQSDAIGIIEFVIERQIWGKIINAVASKHPMKKIFYTRMAQALRSEAPIWMDASSQVVVDRIIRNDFILSLGYRFIYDDPLDFPIA